ncbi:MAG: nucleotide exchange factor GrpE [Gammaproteobacteria bacterium]|nr:nucleotide exchange factor GrpE [Gammaproteobacteria bacterium]MDH3578399.1 nucleotide exchange factor GrpE [Gammaproteobacteria bacterium]
MNGQAERPDTEAEAETSGAEPEAAEADGEDPGAALAEAEAKAADNWERYVRAAAETENVRKRAARDVENAHRFALERFGKELLAVKDGLEMALAASENASVESLLEGSEATLKLLGSTMERFGIEQVDPEGESFDPEWHEAISVQPSDKVEPGTVLTVVQKGYSLNGRLLRPAMVIVAAE